MSDVAKTETSVAKSGLHRWKRLLFIFGTLLCIAAISSWVFRANLLVGAANLWIVNEPVTKADAIYVLGGGAETRPFEAARLFREGFAPRILLSSTRIRRYQKVGLQPPEAEIIRSILLKEGVPETAITAIGEGNANTRDEAVALAMWCNENHAKSVIIPTDLFHTHRVAWLFRKALQPLDANIQVTACEPPEYSSSNWWQHEEGIIAFQNEIMKYLYYRVRY